MGNGFALVTSCGLSVGERQTLHRRGAVVLVAEPDGELARWLRRGRATAAIVRPDRTVMRAGRGVRELCEAMPDFLLQPTERIVDA
jgi:3-(3-hydroxy-phenyl)propionate hydroxylase